MKLNLLINFLFIKFDSCSFLCNLLLYNAICKYILFKAREKKTICHHTVLQYKYKLLLSTVTQIKFNNENIKNRKYTTFLVNIQYIEIILNLTSSDQYHSDEINISYPAPVYYSKMI